MMKKLLSSLLVLSLLLISCGFAGEPMLDDIHSRDIYPGTPGTYQIGSADYKYTDIWCETLHSDAETIYIGETALTEVALIALLEGGSPESGGLEPHDIAFHTDTSATGAQLDELVGGGETILHTHPGNGGLDIVIKAGTIVTDGSGNGNVTFNTSFSDINYSIALAPSAIGIDAVIVIYGSKAIDGFSVQTYDDGGKAEGSIDVDWVAIEYNNP